MFILFIGKLKKLSVTFENGREHIYKTDFDYEDEGLNPRLIRLSLQKTSSNDQFRATDLLEK